MHNGCQDHDDAGPGVQYVPVVAFEQHGQPIHWVASALVAADDEIQEINAAYGRQDGADQ